MSTPIIRNLHALASYKNNRVLNIIGPSQNTLKAIYDISFILYNNIPYSISSKTKIYHDNLIVPSYYKYLPLQIKSGNTQVILNKCDIIQCKEILNIQEYVKMVSFEKWKTLNLFVVPEKQDVVSGCNSFDFTMCDECLEKINPKIFVLSQTIEEKVSFIDKLLS